MNKENLKENEIMGNSINSGLISIMCDDRCCGHCKYYDGNGYCSDEKPVRPTDWCPDFKYA